MSTSFDSRSVTLFPFRERYSAEEKWFEHGFNEYKKQKEDNMDQAQQSQEQEKVYGSLSKNTLVKLKEYKGVQYIDIRQHFPGKFNGALMIPTKKGISMRAAEISDLITILEKIEADLKGGKNG